MKTTVDLRRFPPTPDDTAAGFRIAQGGIAAAIKRAEDRHGPTVLVSAFVMLGDIMTSFGLRGGGAGPAGPPGAQMQLERTH
jgi:hypothetical protein